MSLLKQNTKMKKSSDAGYKVYNWTIPAFRTNNGFKTCPNAGVCAVGCYAQQGAYRFSSVSAAHHRNLDLAESDNFVRLMIQDIEAKIRKPDARVFIRIHDSGDFYSDEYTKKWLQIINHFLSTYRVFFYAYTKEVARFKSMDIPENFRVIYSFGGKQDHLIDPNTDRHARVFETTSELKAAGYINASNNDLRAIGVAKKIGLVYHGTKNYDNTAWNKAA